MRSHWAELAAKRQQERQQQQHTAQHSDAIDEDWDPFTNIGNPFDHPDLPDDQPGSEPENDQQTHPEINKYCRETITHHPKLNGLFPLSN